MNSYNSWFTSKKHEPIFKHKNYIRNKREGLCSVYLFPIPVWKTKSFLDMSFSFLVRLCKCLKMSAVLPFMVVCSWHNQKDQEPFYRRFSASSTNRTCSFPPWELYNSFPISDLSRRATEDILCDCKEFALFILIFICAYVFF